jgi:uncharacterized protein YdaU (DUF1376 family)
MSHPFMQVYVADYTADVQHLTCEQDGAYWRLLRAMWRLDGILPNDPAKLARICGLSLARWAKISPDVLELLTFVDEGITQDRLLKEIENVNEKSSKRSEAGKLGVIAKSLKNNKTGLAIAEPLLKHSLELEPEIEIIDTNVSISLRARGAPKTPKIRPSKSCPKGWYPSQADIAVGTAKGLSPETIGQQIAIFRDHEFKTPKSNWSAAFRNWLRRSEEMSLERPNQNQSSLQNGGLSPSESRRAGAALAIAQRRAARASQDDDGSGSSSAQVLSWRGAEVGAARA